MHVKSHTFGKITGALIGACVIGKGIKYPDWSSMADNAIIYEFWHLWSKSVVTKDVRILHRNENCMKFTLKTFPKLFTEGCMNIKWNNLLSYSVRRNS